MLVKQASNGQVEATDFARNVKASGLKIITWTFESARTTAAVYGDKPGLDAGNLGSTGSRHRRKRGILGLAWNGNVLCKLSGQLTQN